MIKGVSQNFRSKKDQILHDHMTIFEMSHRMLTYCNHGDNDFHQKKKKTMEIMTMMMQVDLT